jgi:class 3 adenylate cyclase
MAQPETQYVSVGDGDVAYQVVGDAPKDLLFCYGLGSHIELIRQIPGVDSYFDMLAASFRLIMFDRRGTGASDGLARNAVPTLEEWTDDVHAVLDAVGSKRAALFSNMDTGPIAILYTAMHPERVSALALMNSWARIAWDEDYPIGFPESFLEEFVEAMATQWGSIEFLASTNPTVDDAEVLRLMALVCRASATPRTAAAQWSYMMRHDVRHVLPLIQVPTLVLESSGSLTGPAGIGRYLADHITGAKYVELPSADMGWTRANLVVGDEMAEFLTGERPAVEVDRVLTTVLFTDIVGSTERAASLGDHRWREVLDAHDRVTREQLHRFRGREINTTGDGFVASFDGPARAIQCAQAIVGAAAGLELHIRAGLHTGECEVRGDDLGGLAVHIAARVSSLAAPGEVWVSGTVKDLVVGSDIAFDARGEHPLHGVPGEWKLFAVKE